MLELATLVCGKPDKYKRLLSWPPPVKPISVCAASPGPLTTHPIIDKVIGFFTWDNFFSNSFTLSIIGCVVNGPGEAAQTEIGLTGGGQDNTLLYLSGVPHSNVPSDEIID